MEDERSQSEEHTNQSDESHNNQSDDPYIKITSDDPYSKTTSDEPPIDQSDEAHNESQSDEPRNASQSDEPRNESQSDEPRNESQLDEPRNESQSDDQRSVCRDYERGACSFGDRCRYAHPPDLKPKMRAICKDYQKGKCDRRSCKFAHIMPEQEEEYERTGVVPKSPRKPRGRRDEPHNGPPPFHPGPPPPGHGGPPPKACNDFQKGKCNRANCRYRHVTKREADLEMHLDSLMMPPMGMAPPMPPPPQGGPDGYGKRRRGGGDMEDLAPLREKIADLQKEVHDLRQMNDDLYEQNTRYRNQLQQTVKAPSAQVDNAAFRNDQFHDMSTGYKRF